MISSEIFIRPSSVATPRATVYGRLTAGTVPMVRASLACQAVVVAVTAPSYQSLGLSFAWQSVVPHLIILMVVFGAWAYHQLVPDRNGVLVNDLLLAVFLLLLLTNLTSPAQYSAVALKRPLVDDWLAAADAALGVHVPSMVMWMRAHPRVDLLLTICYYTLLPQLVLAPVAATLVLKDRQRLWEYVFHFHFLLIATLVSLALFPAACAFAHYGFESTLNQSRFIHQFQGLRDGSFTTIRFNDLEGLISMPSFHAAGAMMVTWMFRGHRRWFVPVALLNIGLLTGTVMSGAHYFIDVLATVGIFLLSLVAFQFWGQQLSPTGEQARETVTFSR